MSEDVNYTYPGAQIYVRRSLLSTYMNYSAQAHWHPDVEFIYIHSGTMDYNVNGQITTLSKGEGIFVNSKQIHYGFSDKKECDFTCIIFDQKNIALPENLRDHYTRKLTTNKDFPFLKLEKENHKKILKELKTVKQDSDIFDLEEAFLKIWKELLSLMPENTDKNEKETEGLSDMRAMLEYIHTNYYKNITLTTISQSANISISKCCREFQKYLGQTPTNYLNQYRIKTAMELLKTTDNSITAIADRVGFQGPSYFSETFKKFTGTTPREYRQK